MDIRKFCKKRLHVEVEASEASDAIATATDVPNTACRDKPYLATSNLRSCQVW